jgi:hypothetical protein
MVDVYGRGTPYHNSLLYIASRLAGIPLVKNTLWVTRSPNYPIRMHRPPHVPSQHYHLLWLIGVASNRSNPVTSLGRQYCVGTSSSTSQTRNLTMGLSLTA